MDDPYAFITSECIIAPEAEEALRDAAEIVEPCSSSVIRWLDSRNFPAASNPDKTSDIQMLPDSPPNPHDKEDLNGISALKCSSSFPQRQRQRLPPPEDLAALIKYFSNNSDKSSPSQDILEIAESKGIFFPPPSWWRPGGYEKVP